MNARLLLAALALAFIIEGATPLIAPAAWRRAMQQLAALRDGQLRFIALAAVASGVLLLLALV